MPLTSPAPAPQRRRKKIRLQTALVIPFVIQLVVAVSVVSYLSFRHSQQAVNDLVIALQTKVSDRVQQHLDRYLATPKQINEINLGAVKLGMLNIQDLRQTGRYFWRQMQVFSDLGYVNYGSQDGQFIGVMRENDGSLYLEMIEPPDVNRIRRYAVDQEGRPTRQVDVVDYAFQEDAWYTSVANSRQPRWSPIYQWGDRPDVFSISSSYPVYDEENRFIGVIGIDFILSQLNTFLKDLNISPSGRVFIIEPSGLIVGSSSPEDPYVKVKGQIQRLNVLQSRDPLLQATAQAWLQQFERFDRIKTQTNFKMDLANDRALAQVSRWQDEFGLDWLIVVVIPESDFMDQIHINTRNTVLFCLVALLLAIVIGLLTARWLVHPIARITAASQAMARGNLNQHIPSSPIIELETLVQAFNSMAGQLHSSITTLEDKVQERTTALAGANAEIVSLNEKLQAENLRLSAEVDIARQIQQMILPRPEELAAIEDLDIAGFMEPAAEVGGDYYDVLDVDGVVTIGIGDVTGHGLESGLLMLMTQTAVRTLREVREHDPVRFLDTINRTIYKNIQRMNSDRNLTLAVLNYNEGRLSISGQHEETIVVRRNGDIERIDTFDLGFPIGLEDDIAAFISHKVLDLYPGDGVVLYTDGITEAENLERQHYGIQRFCDVISQNWHRSAAEIKAAMIADLRQHIGQQKVFDDITLLIFKRQAPVTSQVGLPFAVILEQ